MKQTLWKIETALTSPPGGWLFHQHCGPWTLTYLGSGAGGGGTLILTGIDIHLPRVSNLFSHGNPTKIVDEIKDQQDCLLRKNTNTFMRLKTQAALEWPGKQDGYSVKRILPVRKAGWLFYRESSGQESRVAVL